MKRKILVMAPAWLGDLIMAQSLLKILFSKGHTLHVAAPLWNHAVLQCMPEVSQAIELPFTHGDFKLRERFEFAQGLKAQQYDQAIVLQNSFKSALIPFFAKIPIRTGWLGEMRFGLLNDYRTLNPQALPLMVQRFMALADLKAADQPVDLLPQWLPSLTVSPLVVSEALEKFHLKTQRPVLILCPGAAFGDSKRWPPDYFAAVARQKMQAGFDVWLLGSAADRSVTEQIQSQVPVSHPETGVCIDLAGQLMLPETVALVSKAAVVVSNDSGLLHVAAALQRPLIGIYGSTSCEFTPPLFDQKVILEVQNLACRPCFQRTCRYGHLRCLTDIQPSQLLEAVDQLLARSA